MTKKSNYIVDGDGVLKYAGTSTEHTVWGVGKYGMLHGAGAYLKRETLGVDYFTFNESPYNEIERYYVLLDKLNELRDE